MFVNSIYQDVQKKTQSAALIMALSWFSLSILLMKPHIRAIYTRKNKTRLS